MLYGVRVNDYSRGEYVAADHVAFRGHVMNASPPVALDNKINYGVYDS